MLTVKIQLPEEGGLQTKRYEVDVKKGSTVLQVLEIIFQTKGPTLAYRYSCRIGLCGTCNVMVNGKPELSCMKRAEPQADGMMTIEPMPRGKTIRDLVKKQ